MPKQNPRDVYGKNPPTFCVTLSTGGFHSAQRLACGKECEPAGDWGPSRGPQSPAGLALHPERITPAPLRKLLCRRPSGTRKSLRRPAMVSYHPYVCSIMGDAIDRIAAAIDQVASDARGAADEPELTARVAEIWLMMGALDPELSRRQQGYTAPADGTPR